MQQATRQSRFASAAAPRYYRYYVTPPAPLRCLLRQYTLPRRTRLPPACCRRHAVYQRCCRQRHSAAAALFFAFWRLLSPLRVFFVQATARPEQLYHATEQWHQYHVSTVTTPYIRPSFTTYIEQPPPLPRLSTFDTALFRHHMSCLLHMPEDYALFLMQRQNRCAIE
jgi:hypothetical protein